MSHALTLISCAIFMRDKGNSLNFCPYSWSGPQFKGVSSLRNPLAKLLDDVLEDVSLVRWQALFPPPLGNHHGATGDFSCRRY